MLRRVICAAVLQNQEGQFLLCKAHPDYGVFPNQWAFPGGGMEENETLEEAVRREVREEVGLELESFKPLEFTDDFRVNDEFIEYKWVNAENVLSYDLNEPARQTFHTLFHGK